MNGKNPLCLLEEKEQEEHPLVVKLDILKYSDVGQNGIDIVKILNMTMHKD